MATYAIGDIQGCYRSLQALLKQLPLLPDDEIWLCGDLVNRGPRSLEVLRWAMRESRVVAVLGNHDLHLLSAAAGQRKPKARDTFEDVLSAPDKDSLLAWLRARPLLHRSRGFVMVHAGLHPRWSISLAEELALECSHALQNDNWLDAWANSRPRPPTWNSELRGESRLAAAFSVLVGVRTLQGDVLNTKFAGPTADMPTGDTPWFAGRCDDEVIVFGHWAALGLDLQSGYMALDSGCVWGQCLSAVRLEDRKVYQQPSLD